ncbi:MAG: MscL family protein [Aliidongia sp.]
MLKEFRDFAMRGNVPRSRGRLHYGRRLRQIVTSLVSDIIMPPIGLILGKVDFSSLYINLSGKITRRWPMPRKPGRRRSITGCSSTTCSISSSLLLPCS